MNELTIEEREALRFLVFQAIKGIESRITSARIRKEKMIQKALKDRVAELKRITEKLNLPD